MALNMHISNALARVALNALLANASGGFIKIYTGAQPATPDTALSGQTLLVTLNLSAPAFAAAGGVVGTSGTIAANTIAPGVAVATGTAAWFRMYASDGATALVDGTVGTATSDLILGSTAITSGDTIAVSAYTVTLTQ